MPSSSPAANSRSHYWLFLLLWLPFVPLIWSGRTFLLGDCATFEIPSLTFLFRHWNEDWFPWTNGGIPARAYLLGRHYYLPQFLCNLGSPQKLCLYYFLLHQLVGFGAALTYLTHRSFSRLPASLGALTYAGSSAMIQLSLNFVFLPLLAMAPLLLYFFERLLQSPKPRDCLALSVLLAMLLCSGGFQIFPIFGAYIFLVTVLDHYWLREQPRPSRMVFFWLGLAGALALVYWLPVGYAVKSNYLTGPVRAFDLSPEMGGRLGISDQLPLQAIYPLFYGPLADMSKKVGHTNHEFVLHIGAAFFPLFLLGLQPNPGRRRWVLLWLGVFLLHIFFAFGGENPVYRFLQTNLPGLAKLRGPTRILYPFPLLNMALIACGAESLLRGKSRIWLALLLYYFAYLLWGRPDFGLAHLLLVVSLVAALGYCQLKGKAQLISLLVASVCQVSAPVLYVEQEYYATDSTCTQEVQLLRQLKEQLKTPLVGIVHAINAESAAMADVRTVTGICPLMNRAFVDYFFFALYGREMTNFEFEHLRWQSFCPSSLLAVEAIKPERWHAPMMQMLSLQFLVMPEGVQPLKDHFPGFWISREAQLEASAAKTRALLNQTDYDPQSKIFIDQTYQGQPVYSAGQPTLTSYSPSKFSLSLQGASGWLVISSLYDPGWAASVDGRPVTIYRANSIFSAVPISPGSKSVEFTFQDVGRRKFWWTPLAASLAWMLLFFVGKTKPNYSDSSHSSGASPSSSAVHSCSSPL